MDSDSPTVRRASQGSEDSHTAAEFLDRQLQLEADAREVLPFSIENCTKPLGPLRQNLFACLTCNPPSTDAGDSYTPAGICYSCSVQCHGEHTLVELFNKRNFTCDCGTTRFPSTAPCALRLHPETNVKGGVHSEEPDLNNKYNQNFHNKFCGCELDYDPYMEKGTMFQCLGLGTTETGGCGEDWWHPQCILGLGPNWVPDITNQKTASKKLDGLLQSITEVAEDAVAEPGQDSLENGEDNDEEDEDPPLPPGFPHEDDFEGFLCYKCVDSNPWIRQYARAPGFLAPVFRRSTAPSPERGLIAKAEELVGPLLPSSNKRKAADEIEPESDPVKRAKTNPTEPSSNIKADDAKIPPSPLAVAVLETASCKIKDLPPATEGQFSLFFTADFRSHLCRCSSCFPNLTPHPQLLEEEDIYEPPVSENGDDAGGSTVGSGSIYDRGESALKNVDRVKAIEGVMAYNHLKDKLKPFFQQFAESGQAISAEDIKAHFAKMRGDEQAIKDAGEGAKVDGRK